MSEKGRIGDRLVARGFLTRAVAETIAVETVLAGTRFGSVAANSKRVRDAEVLKVLSAQLGIPGVDLTQMSIPRAVLDRIPAAVAKQHGILPIGVDDHNLLVAVADVHQNLLDEFAFATGLTIRPYVALHTRLTEALAKSYAPHAQGFEGAHAQPGVLAVVSDPVPAPKLAAPIGPTDEPLDLTRAAPVPPLQSAVLPPPIVSASPVATAQATSGVGRGKVILVVDDEAEIRELVVEALKSTQADLVTASRGIEALELIKSVRPDLIILDAMLPEVHGFEICRKVKNSKRFGQTPVLMISAIYRGWRIAEDIKSLYGVDVFLEKPFRIGELRRHTEALLAHTPLKMGEAELNREAQARYEAGLKAAQAGDWDAALTSLRAAESLEPFAAKVQFQLGWVLEMRDRAFQAIYHYERAVELEPELFAATKSLALLYQAKGFRHKAVDMWERCIKTAPTNEIREQIKEHLVGIL